MVELSKNRKIAVVTAALMLILVAALVTIFLTSNNPVVSQGSSTYIAKIHVQNQNGSPVENDTIAIEQIRAGVKYFWGLTDANGDCEITIYSDWPVKAVFVGGDWISLTAFSLPLPSEYFPKTYTVND
jgi:hypothetical protein